MGVGHVIFLWCQKRKKQLRPFQTVYFTQKISYPVLKFQRFQAHVHVIFVYKLLASEPGDELVIPNSNIAHFCYLLH